MTVYKRNILKSLDEWKLLPNRKPLVIRGARQVGKTTVIKEFSKQFKYFIALNLEIGPDAALFETYREAKTFLDALFLREDLPSNKRGKTLLFIDEIQENTLAISLLRYLYEDFPELYVIAAGSLLEHALGDVKNFPVGRVQYLYLSPFNFQEFLLALGKDALLLRLQQVPVDSVAHDLAMDLFHQYAIVGGMPEAIKSYQVHKMVSSLGLVYESIWATYKEDVVKYAKNESEARVMKHIIDNAPLLLDQRVTFQNFANSRYNSREVGECFQALDKAKVIQLIYPTVSTRLPIIPDIRKSPRMQFLDTGIVNHVLGIQGEMLSMDDLSTSYKGALIPHLITQEIISLNTFSYQKPNFWVRQKKQSDAELDLLYSYRGHLFPIEVKSGKTGTLRSLHQFIKQSGLPFAVRFYGGEFLIEKVTSPEGNEFVLMNMPYYLGTFINEYLDYLLDTHK